MNTDVIRKMLEGEFAAEAIRYLGIENDPPEAQAAVISMIGETVFARVLLEILKKLPASSHDEFAVLQDAGEPEAMDAFLRAHIPEFDAFVQEETRKELEAITARAGELAAEN